MPIEHLESDINESLHLTMNRGRYQLSTASAIYSYADLYDNFTRTFKRLDFDKLPNSAVLILGFGLGSIPIMLEKKFNRTFQYTGIELDETVIYLAQKYVLNDLESYIELIQTDAQFFMDQTTQKFGMICMDVFLDSQVPKKFESEHFLFQLKACLSPGGVLLYNRLANDTESTNQTRYFFEYTFKNVFPEGSYLDVGGNWMLLSDNQTFF